MDVLILFCCKATDTWQNKFLTNRKIFPDYKSKVSATLNIKQAIDVIQAA